jgi:predicted RNase H-like nuclease (RuvC/YqgF family)
MSKTEEQSKVPPPLLDEDGNLIMDEDGTNTKTSMAPTLEKLMRRLEELTAENKKLRAKAEEKQEEKGDSSSSEEEDSSFEEDVSKKEKKGRRNRNKPSFNVF